MTLRRFAGSAVWIVLLLASATWLLAAVSPPPEQDTDGPRFGPWSAPVNIGPPVNTTGTDYQPFISKDELSLYFVRLEGNVLGGPQDIWVAKRGSKSDDWGEPRKLGPSINTSATEAQPFVSVDGHWLYFNSDRTDAGGFGVQDIYVSRRHNKREDLPTDPSGGWQEPANLGAGVNTIYNDQCPFVFEDELTGATTLYFHSMRPSAIGGLGGNDIYASTLQPDGTFGPAVLVAELSTPFNDELVTIRRDGLEMFFISDRPGSTLNANGNPSRDIWVSTRASTLDPWGTPENLDVVNARMGGPPVNSPFHDGRPSLSFDGMTLYFFSAFRPGNQSMYFDIWMTTRTRLRDRNKE